MKKDNKGFTLIELLATIVILAIIFLIVTPLVVKYIGDARNQAFINTAQSLAKQAQMECAAENECYFVVEDGIMYESDDSYAKGSYISSSGGEVGSGKIFVNKDGLVTMAFHNNSKCTIKNINDKKFGVTDYNGSCTL